MWNGVSSLSLSLSHARALDGAREEESDATVGFSKHADERFPFVLETFLAVETRRRRRLKRRGKGGDTVRAPAEYPIAPCVSPPLWMLRPRRKMNSRAGKRCLNTTSVTYPEL